MSEALQRKWRTKIERLPVDCRFIKKTPDLGDVRIREAKSLFDLRNRIAHSYPDRIDMKLGTMWFHQSFPVLPEAVPSYQFAMAMNNQLPSKKQALDGRVAAEGLVDYLRELLADDMRDKFEIAANSNPIGYNETKGIYGVPFGKSVIIAAGME